MKERVTISQVAAAAGVSAMTVSNVVNGRPGAAEATRLRVLEVAQRLGYRVNRTAQQLRVGRTGLIGMFTVDLTSEFIHAILQGVAEETALDERELLLNVSVDAAEEAPRARLFGETLTDGLLYVAPALSEETLRTISELRIPAVVIDPRRLDVPLPRVTVDNYHGLRAATEHLIALGHTRIGYIRGEEDHDTTQVRRRGYVDAMKLAGLRVEAQWEEEANFSYESGFAAATVLLARGEVTAIVCGADLIALGAVDAARSNGLIVPEDISVVGFDDIPRAKASYPPLTTVHAPLRDMGRAGARMLLDLIDGRTPVPSDLQLRTQLIVRGTSTAPRP